MDPPDVPYESKNIVWMTELPARSTSTPIVVGSRIFVMAEPDELLCLDKQSGRFSDRAQLLRSPAAGRAQANPAYAAKSIRWSRRAPRPLARVRLRARFSRPWWIDPSFDPANDHFESTSASSA
jgi:hypothetical protein